MANDVIDLQRARHSPRVARRRAARIREILTCALETMRDEGVDALTLTRLAEHLEVTTAALYRYFDSKIALDAEVQRTVIAALIAQVRDCTEVADAYAEQRALAPAERTLLAVVVHALVFEAFARTAPAEFGFLAMNLATPEFTLPEREAGQVFEAAWSALVELGERIEAAQDCGALAPGDANERAVVLWSALQGVLQTRKLVRSAGDRFDPSRITHDLLTSLLAGWGAEAKTTARALEIAEREGFADDLESTLAYLSTNNRSQP